MAELRPEQKAEIEVAQQMAARYHFDFVDLQDFKPDMELLRSISLELMLHYQFLPLERRNGNLVVGVANPTDLARLDELEMKLDCPLIVKVATPSQV